MSRTLDPYASLADGGEYTPRPRTDSEVKVVRQRFMTEDYSEIHAAQDMASRVKDDLAEARRLQKLAIAEIDGRVYGNEFSTFRKIPEQSDGEQSDDENDNNVDAMAERSSQLARQRRSQRQTQHASFLAGLQAKAKQLSYVRPELRYAQAQAHSSSSGPALTAASGPENGKEISFGLHDALDLDTITELRKVFFRSEEEEGGEELEEESTPPRKQGLYEQDEEGVEAVEEKDPLEETFNDDDSMMGGNWESRGLDLDEFIEEFGHIIGANLSRGELQTMFMKIDANSDGDVDWDEFTNWMLKMEAGAHSMTEDKELGMLHAMVEQTGEAVTLHRGMVNCISQCKIPGLSYVTGGRDGSIRFWNSSTLEHLRTINVLESNKHYMKLHSMESEIPGAESLLRASNNMRGTKKLWITCVQVMPLCNRIAVAAADRSVTFYDLFTIEVACRVRNLKHAPTAMAYHVSGTHSKVQFLTLGDDSGKIHVFKLKPHFYFREGLDETGNEAFSYWKRKSEKLEKQGLLEYYTQQLHSDWITKCIYIADIQPSILTCSLDMTVKFFNVEKKIFEREFEGHRDNKEGVQALLYIKAVKCMASCGVGRTIITWNPHTCEKNSGATLRGHVAPVTHLATDDVNSRLISVSMDKVIKFWDTSTWRCMQSTADSTNYRPDNFISAIFWDSDLQQLITAGNRVKVWHHEGTDGVEEMCSHESPVCSALFNKNFQQVVSGDATGNVKVWAIETGRLVFRFDKLHGESKITTMSFDWSMRRLITGAHDGSVKMWNFSNGSQLKEFVRESHDDLSPDQFSSTTQTANNSEVTAVRYILEEGGADDIEHKFIVSCSWDKKVRVFEDGDDDVGEPHRIFPAPGFAGHNDDILCIAHCEPRLLATGSYDGEIVVWSLASGSGRFFLRLSDYGDYDDPELNHIQHEGLPREARSTAMDSRANRPSKVWDASAEASPRPPAEKTNARRSSTFGAEHRKLVETNHLKTTKDPNSLWSQKAKAHLGDGPEKEVHHHSARAGGGTNLDEEEKKGGESDVPSDEKGNLAVECLLFLKTKRIGEVLGQTLVSAGADGKVRFWSVKDGSLCHVLKACHPNDSSITCMASDESNKYLFTGCASGCIKVWTLKSLEKAAGNRLHRRFSVLGVKREGAEAVQMHRQWADAAVPKKKRVFGGTGAPETVPDANCSSPSRLRGSVLDGTPGGASSPGVPPGGSKRGGGRRRMSMVESDYALPKVYEISSWKAHAGTLVSIEYVGSHSGKELILTASTDCNVSIWTVMGSHLGIFGQGSSWSLTNMNHWIEKKEHGVEKPKGAHAMGRGVLGDEDGEELGVGMKKKKRMKKTKKEQAMDEVEEERSENEGEESVEDSSDSSVEEVFDEDGKSILDKEKVKARKKYQKLMVKFEQVVALSNGKLEPYHYLLAKAKLDKKLMIFEAAKTGGKGADSPIVKETLWNKRWGGGLKPNIPNEDEIRRSHGGITIGPGGFHEVLIRSQSIDTGEGMGVGDGSGRKGAGVAGENIDKVGASSQGKEDKKAGMQLKMMELRSNYNSVAHQLGVHAIDTVEGCRGASLVKKRRNERKDWNMKEKKREEAAAAKKEEAEIMNAISGRNE